MSIATAISALQSASSDIASAIAAKGVTVPSGSGYDDYATLIASIQTGGGGGDPELPSGYTRHKYIESAGGCVINTGISGAASWSIVMQATDSSQTSVQFLGNGTGAGQFFGIMSTGKLGFSTSSKQYVNSLSSTVKFDAQILFASDRLLGSVNQYGIYRDSSSTRTGTYIILGLTTSSVGVTKAKIWEADAWQGGVRVFHGIPCVRNSDNIAGLYNTVTSTFLRSFGANDFTAGD